MKIKKQMLYLYLTAKKGSYLALYPDGHFDLISATRQAEKKQISIRNCIPSMPRTRGCEAKKIHSGLCMEGRTGRIPELQNESGDADFLRDMLENVAKNIAYYIESLKALRSKLMNDTPLTPLSDCNWDQAEPCGPQYKSEPAHH